MNISVQKLLAKMNDELAMAKAASTEEILREKVYSIKILCELILDEKQTKREPVVTAAPVVTQPQTILQPISMNQPQTILQPISMNQPKKLVVDDEANGDSLFDF